MKNIKQVLIISVLTISTAFLLQNCRKDEYSIEQTQSNNKLHFEYLTYKEFKNQSKIEKVIEKLEKSSKSDNNAKADANDSSFSVSTDWVSKVTEDDIETYTFLIEEPLDENSIFENFIIERIADSIYNLYIYHYKLKADYQNSDEFKYSLEISNVNPETFDVTTLSNYLSKVTINDDCIEITYESCSAGGNADGHAPAAQEGGGLCSGSAMIIDVSNCDFGEMNGNGGSTNDNNSGNQGYNGGNNDTGNTGTGGNGGYNTGGTSTTPSSTSGMMGVNEVDLIIQLANALGIDMLSTEGSQWYNNTRSNLSIEQIQNLLYFLGSQGMSEEAIDFVNVAMEALEEGGEVDFPNLIILDNEFINNDCLSGVYSGMKENSSSFKDYLQNFMGETPVAHLKFNYDENFDANQPDEYDDALAITEPPQNYVINITFNGDSNLPSSIHNKPKLIIAVAFIHEMIHAEIYRKMLSAAQLGNLNTTGMTPEQQENYVNNLRNDFPGLFDYYVDRWRSDWGHQLMAQHYVDIIKNAIAEYDNNEHSQQTYEAIAWMGLYNTIAWNNLSPTEQETLTNNINTFIQNDTDTCN